MIHQSVGSSDRQVHWDVDRVARGLWTAQITLIICYQIEHMRDSYVQYP
jgi:hypothetical protein